MADSTHGMDSNWITNLDASFDGELADPFDGNEEPGRSGLGSVVWPSLILSAVLAVLLYVLYGISAGFGS